MRAVAAVVGLALLALILWDGFETIILPRRVTRRIRLSRIFYRSTWFIWSHLAGGLKSNKRRDRYLSFYGPLSLLLLIAVWAVGLICAFALLLWMDGSPGGSFGQNLYMSGSNFITLGLGDVLPKTPLARFITVAEAGTGFGFLALLISYLPVLYQAFSRRETDILLLDARGGSPPAAAELVRRYAVGRSLPALDQLLRDWEIWAADLLESYISFPVLAYFRSQHDNQSWLGALTTILDVCAIVIAGVEHLEPWQARLTFAMARHTVVDLAQIVDAPPRAPDPDRLPPDQVAKLKSALASAGVSLENPAEFDAKLARLRRMYEPYVSALADHLLVNLTTWMRAADTADNWRTSAWERSSTGLPGSLFDGDDVHAG